MTKIILDKNQINELILINKYKIDPNSKFISRCIDGRYDKEFRIKNLELRMSKRQLLALAIPGADAGEMALVFATVNNYGLEMDMEKVWQTLVKVVGGEKNLRFHTDSHADANKILAGCGHIKQINLDPKAYNLEPNQINFIQTKFQKAKERGAKETVLHGEHNEGAVVMIKGNWGIYPQSQMVIAAAERLIQIFIYHQTLVDERHKILAKKLIDNEAIRASFEFNDEYLYQALSETGENHLMETVKRLAKGLPIYQITFKDNGEFKIGEMGKVE